VALALKPKSSTTNTDASARSTSSAANTSDSTTTSDTSQPQATTGTKTSFTLSEVATHASSSDCWTVIDGSVYDITDYITSHPGGAKEITKACGIDGTQLFATQGGRGSHSSLADKELAKLKIGTISN
jgi:cytochrome b involved in lipid metabolism